MAAGVNTNTNRGIRRIVYTVSPAGYRNFEVNGAQTYNVQRDKGHDHSNGTHYAKGATLPYDAAGGTLYANPKLMERDFNSGALDPSS